MSEFDLIDREDKPKTVVEWLAEVSYIDDPFYKPTGFALEFVNFIKLVNGHEGEEHKTPAVHLRMLDNACKEGDVINMCHRGLAKTTVLGEYLFLYISVYGEIPGFDKIDLAIYVSDSMENGVKNMRKNLEFRWENSEFLQKYVPHTRFTDQRWEFNNIDGKRFIVKGYGAKALSLDTKLYTEDGYTTIADVKVGDMIFGADGDLAQVTKKSEIFHKPMYKITLEDGRTLKVSEDHINSVVHKENVNNNATHTRKDLYTHELLELPLQHVRSRKRKGKPDYTSKENLLFVENNRPLRYKEKSLPIDPYTLGLLLGDGSMKKDGSVVLHAHIDDMVEYLPHIPYGLGSYYVDKRNGVVASQVIKGLSAAVRELGVNTHGDYKFIPPEYLVGSIEQRLELLKGLLDTDGSIQKNGRIDFCSNSEQLVDGVSSLVRSLAGTTKKRRVGKAFRIEIWIEYVAFRLKRKATRSKHRNKPLLAITSIEPIALVPSQCIAIDNKDHQFIAGEYFRTHNTGVRGAKEMGVRPTLAVLDDLISDEDARSATIISAVEDTVYKAVDYALHPTNKKIVWSGTPFNAKDPLYKAVESGAWNVNVYPVCEKFPCERDEFRGSWPDRFTFDYVEKQYTKAMKSGKVDTFNQELMLKIMSDEDRLIMDQDIKWYDYQVAMSRKSMFNYYITTDFATSEKTASDFSVISVWGYNAKGDWYWVDGICKRQLMDANIDDLFRLAQKWMPQQVGIEVSGQQGGFIPWIEKEMLNRNIFFTLASENNSGKAGVRPSTNKMERFNVVVPWFKTGRMWFPENMKHTMIMREAIDELSLAAPNGFRSKHDDFIDTISMLAVLHTWKPSAGAVVTSDEYDPFEDVGDEEDESAYESYLP